MKLKLILIIFIGYFLLSFRILETPPGINGDEAVIGLNAILVSRAGYDINGRFLPIFTANKDSWDWKQPVTFYSEVIAFRLFGPSFFTLRAVSVILALLGGILIFLTVYELLGVKLAIVGLIIFLLTPIVVIQSHLAMENIAAIPPTAIWLWMLIKYSKQPKKIFILLAAISLGVGLYSYLGLRLIVPMLAVISLIYIYLVNRNFRKSSSHLAVFIAGLLPFILLLLSLRNFYPAAVFAHYRPIDISSYQQLILPYISSFDPSFLFISGDTTPYHSTGKHGMFLLATLPLFLLGIFNVARKNNFLLNFILLTFLLIPLPLGITPSFHRASRLLALVPFYIIFVCLGLRFLMDLKIRLIKFSLVTLTIVLIILNSADFLKTYWYEYPLQVKSEFAKPYQLVFDRAYQLQKQKNSKVFIQDDFRAQNSIAIDFFELAFFPNKLDLWQPDALLPKNSIVIATDQNISKISDAEKEIFQDFGFGLVVKP